MLTAVWGADQPPVSTGDEIASYIIATAADSTDSSNLHFPFHDRYGDRYQSGSDTSPMFLKDPSNIKTDIQYDPDNNQYNINEKMGELFYRNPSYMSFQEFIDHEFKKSTKQYFKQKAGEDDKLAKKAFAPKINIQ